MPGFRVLRVDRDRPLQGLDRLRQIAGIAQQHADIAPAVRMVRVDLQGLEIGVDGLPVPARGAQDVAQVVVRPGLVRVELQRPADQRDRDLRIAALMREHARIVQRVDMGGIGGENLAQRRRGVLQRARSQVVDGAGELFGAVHRLDLRVGAPALRISGARASSAPLAPSFRAASG